MNFVWTEEYENYSAKPKTKSDKALKLASFITTLKKEFNARHLDLEQNTKGR